MSMRLRSTDHAAPSAPQTRARRTNSHGPHPEAVTRREQSRSRPRQYAYDGQVTRDDYINLKLETAHHRKRVAKYKQGFRQLSALSVLLVLVVAYLLMKRSSATGLQRNRLLLPTPKGLVQYNYEDGKDGLLISARRQELFYVLDGFYKDANVTPAHFGWTLQSPYKALNYNPNRAIVNLHTGNNKDRNRDDLAEYVENYLIAPWRPKGALCGDLELFDDQVCAAAVRRFEHHHQSLLDRKYLDTWARRKGGLPEKVGGTGPWSESTENRKVREMEECAREIEEKRALGVSNEALDWLERFAMCLFRE